MFTNNKYFRHYNLLIEKAKNQHRIKTKGDDLQYHHILPRSLGGNDDPDNIVLLSYKEHKTAHHLLIKITEGQQKYKMMWAYKLFDKNFYVKPPGWNKTSHAKGTSTRKRNGSYKKGKENVFSTEKVKDMVKHRMITNNPMFRLDVKEKYLKNRPHSIHVITPKGYFYSLRAAARAYGIPDHQMRKMVSSCNDGSFTYVKAADRR